MKKLLLFLALFTPLTSLHAGPVAVHSEKIGDGRYVLELENTKDYPVTITLELPALDNLSSQEPLPYTRTLLPNEKADAMTLTLMDPKKPGAWNYTYHWTSGAMDVTPDLSYEYRLPYAAGSGYTVIQGFGGTFSHEGEDRYCVDWAMPEGTPVLAARAGRVMNVQSSFDGHGNRKDYFDKANYVRVLHSDGTVGVYIHLRKDGVVVKEGDMVEEGALIGYSGNVGFSSQPHLHFGVYKVVDGAHQESLPVYFRSGSERDLVLMTGRSYQN